MILDFLKINVPENKQRVKVDTESLFIESLKKEINFEIKVNPIVIDYHWANSIINFGIDNTQKIVDSIYSNFKNDFHRMIFINQHISGEKINWKNGIVFSCHGNDNNNFISIPHMPKVFFKGCRQENYEYFLSFMGSYETHHVRKLLSQAEHPKKTLFLDTGGWHFYNRDEKRENDYRDILSKSLFSLCPRGTGHGTIRLFESLRSGCIPVILSDGYKLPLGLEANKNCVIVKEKDALKIKEILVKIKNVDIKNMLQNVKKYSEKYLENSIESSITEVLKEENVL